jgi:transposase
LLQWIRTLQAEHEKTHVLFGMEPTGHYWMPLALYTLKHFPLPQDIVKRGAERIAAEWKSVVQRSVGIRRAERLVQAAQKSVGLTEGLRMARMELQLLLEQYELLCRQMNQLSEEIQTLLSSIPGAKEMMSIPLVGWVTVAGFLSEVGPLASHDHPQQIIRLAGLNLRENSSGQHKGRTRITKRGRPRLRSLLFKAILPLTAHNPEFQRLHRYLTTRPENPLKKMQSLIALCCRFIRVLFTLGKRQIPYDAHRMMGDIRRSQIQMAV